MDLLRRLSRITTPGRDFIPQIDGLRFVAIITVIMYHVRLIGLFHLGHQPDEPVTDPVSAGFSAGHYGVQLFFLISGFILALPFARQHLAGGKPVDLRGYFLRRLTRIEPPYLIHLAILFLLCVFIYRHQPLHEAMYGNQGWWRYCVTHLGASLFYANGFIFRAHPYPNMVLWSLEVEVQFYLVAPVLAKIFLVKSAPVRRTLLVGAILIIQGVITFLPPGYLVWASLVGNLPFFLAGLLMADWHTTGWLRPSARGALWDFLPPLAAAAVVWIQFHGGALLLPWILLLGCVAAFRGAWAPRVFGNPWIATIGGMCYTIYLYHLIIISTLYRVTIHLQTGRLWLDLLIQFAVMAPVILLVCAGLFAVSERPFMRRDWPARVWTAIRPAPRE